MPDKPFSYIASQQIRKDLSFGRANWKIAEDQYKAGKYFEGLCSTITYIDAEIGARFTADAKKGVQVLHGSVQMNIMVADGQFQVLAPFVNIAQAQKMIILRKICEINFSFLTLAKIECREDTLCFLFSCPLEACEPWKMYDVLKEICWTADKYDDDFVSLHAAAWMYQPLVSPFSDARKEQSWLGFKQYLADAKEWISYWKPLGYSYIAWDVIYICFLKIGHLCNPQASLKNALQTNTDKLFEKKDINDVVNDGIAFLNILDAMAQQSFFAQLYDAPVFIPVKITASLANIQAALKQPLADSFAFISRSEMTSAYLGLQKTAFRLMNDYRFNEAQWQYLESSLAGYELLTLTDASNKLYNALLDFSTNPRDQEMAAPAPDKKEESKSLFAGWFK